MVILSGTVCKEEGCDRECVCAGCGYCGQHHDSHEDNTDNSFTSAIKRAMSLSEIVSNPLYITLSQIIDALLIDGNSEKGDMLLDAIQTTISIGKSIYNANIGFFNEDEREGFLAFMRKNEADERTLDILENAPIVGIDMIPPHDNPPDAFSDFIGGMEV